VIIIGVVLLTDNLGLMKTDILKFWPYWLIVTGLGLIFDRKQLAIIIGIGLILAIGVGLMWQIDIRDWFIPGNSRGFFR